MSAASEPVPRQTPPSASRHTLFLPMLVLLAGLGIQSVYQVFHLEDQLDYATRTVDQLDTTVKHTEYDRGKLLALSRALIDLEPKDPAAAQIVEQFHLHQIETPSNAVFGVSSIIPSSSPANSPAGATPPPASK